MGLRSPCLAGGEFNLWRSPSENASTPRRAASDVLEGKLLPYQLKGRTIVVGPSRNVALGTLAVLWYVATGTGTGTGIGIGIGTGTGTGTTLVSSTEVHASAIDALQQGRYILGASPWVLYLSLALSMWLVFFAFDRALKVAQLV